MLYGVDAWAGGRADARADGWSGKKSKYQTSKTRTWPIYGKRHGQQLPIIFPSLIKDGHNTARHANTHDYNTARTADSQHGTPNTQHGTEISQHGTPNTQHGTDR